jgi:ubiquitin carboxyl-terminal hydrolase 1
VVTHYGRHENGHYICYKKHPGFESQKEQWWRLSDDDVTKVTEEAVLSQGGAFMLFYDCVESGGPATLNPVVDKSTPVEEIKLEEDAVVDPIPLESVMANTAKNPLQSVEQSDQGEMLAVAANIPLPTFDDDDLSESEYQESGLTTREESIATSISDYDSEETGQGNEEVYEPAKAIVVPPYIQQTGGVSSEGAAKENISPSGSLVMV